MRVRSVAVGVVCAVLTTVLTVAAPSAQADIEPPPPLQDPLEAGSNAPPVAYNDEPAEDGYYLCADPPPDAIVGTDGNDTLIGTEGDDFIVGLGGNDHIEGRGGSDIICGDDGNDYIDAGDGDNLVDGGAGNDRIDVGDGNDLVFGGAGNDRITATGGYNELSGEEGNDRIQGGVGKDVIDGGPGNDHLDGGAGDDMVDGGPGNDHVEAGDGDDMLYGGDGNDNLRGDEGTDSCYSGESPGDKVRDCEVTEVPAQRDTFDPALAAPSAVPGPGIVEVTHEPFMTDLRIAIDSNGGIDRNDVQIRRARWVEHFVPLAMMSRAFDITLPSDAPPINGATLTIPYAGAVLPDGYDESHLRILTFDEEFGLWRLPEGSVQQVVDMDAQTVTAQIDHFSIYAVMAVNAAGKLEAFLRPSVPIVCIPDDAGTDVGLDVVLMIDQSGSMSSQDPSDLRVDAAELFVDRMRDQDRVAVISFTSGAVRRASLTELDTTAGRDQVAAAIQASGGATGGTSLSAPMSEMLDVFDDAPSLAGPRARVGVLLTDGVGSYSSSLTTAASEADIVVHTVGLGGGVNDSLLTSIAQGTNGRYEALTSADQLVPLYESLVGGLLDDGTDSDDDGLTDCEESNGMLSMYALHFPDSDEPMLRFSNPDRPHSDGDGLLDSEEAVRQRLDLSPLAEQYDYLIDLGITSYFNFKSYPLETDSDHDSFDDAEDPAPLDPSEPGLDGFPFTVLPTTLFQPAVYGTEPALPDRFVVKPQGSGEILRTVRYSDVVTYSPDFLCVDNCFDVWEWAQAQPTENKWWQYCPPGGADDPDDDSCVTAQTHERDAIKEIIERQGVFTENGRFTSDGFQAEQAMGTCMIYYEGCELDEVAAATDVLDLDEVEPWQVLVVASPAAGLTARVRGLNVNPRVAEVIATNVVGQIIDGDRRASPASRDNATNVRRATRECMGTPVLSRTGLIETSQGLKHPCETMPVYVPGKDLNRAWDLRDDALRNNPTLHLLNYMPEAERLQTLSRDWFTSQPECTLPRKGGHDCDEFPNFRTVQAGRMSPPFALLDEIPLRDNRREGSYFGHMARRDANGCGLPSHGQFIELTLPDPTPPVTFHYCPPSPTG